MNEEKLEQILENYFEVFGQNFPTMQGPKSEIFSHVEECLKKGKRASELFPEIYGSVQGKYY